MGIVTYYARLDADQLARLVADPQLLHSSSFTKTPVVEQVDIDVVGQTLCFLLCQNSRDTARWNHAAMRRLPLPENRPGTILNPVATAIIGATANRAESIDRGYGPAAIFSAAEVANLSAALADVGPAQLREHADFQEMDKLGLSPSGWTDEGEAILCDCLEPTLRHLTAFYARASAAGHHVLVWNE